MQSLMLENVNVNLAISTRKTELIRYIVCHAMNTVLNVQDHRILIVPLAYLSEKLDLTVHVNAFPTHP